MVSLHNLINKVVQDQYGKEASYDESIDSQIKIHDYIQFLSNPLLEQFA